jgi:uncharacterized protein GlcG (DUF336 family)
LPYSLFAARYSLLISAAPAKPGGENNDMRGLSLNEANTIIAATFAAAKKHKCRPMSAIVLDAGGRVKAFQKQDNASMLRFEVCYGKAYGSLALGRPSKLVLQKANEKPLFMQSIENLADYPLFLKAAGSSSATRRARSWVRSGSPATPMRWTTSAPSSASMRRACAPTAISSTMRRRCGS